jgi:eukaryotic-like serine/threonine-protein kinase
MLPETALVYRGERSVAHRGDPDLGPSWDFQEGQAIAPHVYALRLLGGGYKYEAYVAWDERLLSVVVAKVLRPDQVSDPSARRTLEAERDVLERLNHPHIPRFFGGVLGGGVPHLILEFLEGPRLSTLLRKYGTLPVEQLLPLATQLCSALHYMAGRRMVHLDVKPKNIIMGAPPRLIDLSVAHTIESAARARRPIGTDPYMAPEQCEPGPRGHMGPPSDVWGVGVTVYEALAGYLPFPEGSEADRWPQLHHDAKPFPREVPPVLSEPILSCLRPDPEDRPAAAELATALEPLVDMLPRRIILGRLRPRLS